MSLLQTNFVIRALRLSWFVALLKVVVPPLDKWLLRLSRGWLSAAMQTVVLLETVGAKSGQRRTITTLCMPTTDGVVLVGSNWGQTRDPAWVFNLRANPLARMTFRGYRGPVIASELSGKERDTMWGKLVQYNPHYQYYQDNTERRLPIVKLLRQPAQGNVTG
jgi:deazaflavin-dependent oxidoreductase (nitroreductase family)